MPLRNSPSFSAVKTSLLEIKYPAYKGLNLDDLEYGQNEYQTPYMLNMMYRNGSFSKRYGQEYAYTFDDDVYAMIEYRGSLIVHSGSKIYKDGTEISGNYSISAQKGLFVKFNQLLYYYCGTIYQYDGTTFKAIEPYIPDVAINLHPDGTNGSMIDAYNMIGTGFRNTFTADGTSTEYYLTDKELDTGSSNIPSVTVDEEEWTYQDSLTDAKTFKVDFTEGKITFKSAPPATTNNNVEIVAYKHDDEWTSYHDQIVASKYYACFGGNNNSRLFLAGGGKSTYYYSEVYDASFMPYTNYAKVGNSADDITGFGQQYNVLMVFKPTEIYSLSYYTITDDDADSVGGFSSQVVNSSIGCDCPNTIQLINNQLTWLSTQNGVCTLVSTNIVDERNVRVISQNINRTNNMGVVGLLDYDLKETTDIRDTVVACDYDSKYFICFPKAYEKVDNVWTIVNKGMCFMWDYKTTPYSLSSTKTSNPKDLAWYLFDCFYCGAFTKYENELLYISTYSTKKIVKLNDTFVDLDFDGDGEGDGINAYYMTPFMSFGAVDYLKTIKNIYIQCRGDTASSIDIYYYTDESISPEEDPESIRIGGRIWTHMDWDTFEWFRVNWANVFRRKCSLKKVQLAAFYFENRNKEDISVAGRDMSITHIGLEFQVVKAIK